MRRGVFCLVVCGRRVAPWIACFRRGAPAFIIWRRSGAEDRLVVAAGVRSSSASGVGWGAGVGWGGRVGCAGTGVGWGGCVGCAGGCVRDRWGGGVGGPVVARLYVAAGGSEGVVVAGEGLDDGFALVAAWSLGD